MTKLTKTPLILCTLILSACQTTQSNTQTYPLMSKQQAMHGYKECIVSNIDQLDDGRSDANTIASATAEMCRNAYADFIRAQSAGENAHVQNMMMNNMINDQVEIILPMVLRMRR